MGGKEEELHRHLGAQEEALRRAQEDITDLKNKREADRQALQNALEDFRRSNAAYLRETSKTSSFRKGILWTITGTLIVVGWLLRHYPTLAEEILKWLIALTSQTHS